MCFVWNERMQTGWANKWNWIDSVGIQQEATCNPLASSSVSPPGRKLSAAYRNGLAS